MSGENLDVPALSRTLTVVIPKVVGQGKLEAEAVVVVRLTPDKVTLAPALAEPPEMTVTCACTWLMILVQTSTTTSNNKIRFRG